MPILPWDAARIEESARRADRDMVLGAARPYEREAERVRGNLLGAARAANPTRGAAGSRTALLAAAPTLGSLGEAAADATMSARATANANQAARDRAAAENNAGMFGALLNAGSGVGATLLGGLGGGGAPGGAPSHAGTAVSAPTRTSSGAFGSPRDFGGVSPVEPDFRIVGGDNPNAVASGLSSGRALAVSGPSVGRFDPLANPGAAAAAPLGRAALPDTTVLPAALGTSGRGNASGVSDHAWMVPAGATSAERDRLDAFYAERPPSSVDYRAPAAGSASSLAPVAGSAAGTALGGPAGGVLGGALGSAAAPLLGGLLGRFDPFAGMAPSPPPLAGGAPASHVPTLGATAPAGAPMTDAAWAAADEEARRLRARLGY